MFDHIQDEGLRNYLQDEAPITDFNTTANILDVCERHLMVDENDEAIPIHKLEFRHHHYGQACGCFGRRDLAGVHKHIQTMWVNVS